MQERIYMDNAATTRLRPEVFEAMRPYFTELYANPSAIYGSASRVRRAVEEARAAAAATLGAAPAEIYFTSGGTEADNWALTAAAGLRGGHLITSRIEHHAVLNTCAYLASRGIEVTYLDVDREGFVDPRQLESKIRPDTALVSVMFANNEIGTIEPVRELAEIAHAHGALFHTDAGQAYGNLPISVDALGIDMLSASAHKLNGPKGAGFLYIRSGVRIRPFMHGGWQERGRRAGTENVPGIVGLGRAAELAMDGMAERAARERQLRDYLAERLLAEVPGTSENGPALSSDRRLANNLNLSFSSVDGEALLILLDEKGICVSGGSACASGSLDPSHVLLACGLDARTARGALRFTVSSENTRAEIDFVVSAVKEAAEHLRKTAEDTLAITPPRKYL